MSQASTPEQFLQSLTGDRADQITALDNLISKAIPQAERFMWEGTFWGGSDQKILSYGRYSYKRSDKKDVEWHIIGLASQKNYITVFVNAADGKTYLTEKYKDRIGKAKIGKSAISFNDISDINLDVLEELVKDAYKLMS